MNFSEIRDLFPQINTMVHGKQLVYLDNAASTLKPLKVIEAITKHYTSEVSNIHRGVHFLSESGTEKYEQTRESVRNFINAQKREEVIFTKGTTDSLNLIAHSLGSLILNEGDQILLSTMEHHSNIVPWQLIAQKTGSKIIEIPITESGEIEFEEYKKLLNPKVKIVSIVHTSNSLGTVNPIKEMIPLAHEVGAKFVVDAAQAIAHEKIDVQDLNCDFLAFSAHKMYGPSGVGILYGKEDLLNLMPPYQGGGDMIDIVTFKQTTFNDLPYKFEAGTPNIAGFIAFNEALQFLENLNLDEIKTYENNLLHYAQNELKQIKGLKIIGTSPQKGPVCSFVIGGVHPNDLGTLLDQQGIAVRTGHHCTQPLMQRFNLNGTTRASFCLYNTKEEVDYLVKSIHTSLELL
ncbi:MAG: cysteine desulfurase [Halobacteriovoraceae bacterium]|nr:cysteine desulfurase [Halobacteriovoraceae bacterium]